MARQTTERLGLTSYVAGGLGNQLFMLAAGMEQAKRLEVQLALDTSHTLVTGTWGYALEPLHAPAVDIGASGNWTSRRVTKNHVFPFPRRVGALAQPMYRERDVTRFDPAIHTIRPGTFLVGYFQSPKYFPSVAGDIESLIRSVGEDPEERAALERLRAEPAISLHLRRGDYAAAQDRSILASVEYAARAIRILHNMGFDMPVRVFSDSPEMIADELSGVHGGFEIIDQSIFKSPFSVLKAMSAGRAMVMSNSTFSWWAAWLMSRANPHAQVIAPRPWDISGTARADLVMPEWLTLDARP